MALIPYRDVPETETLKKDPPLTLVGLPTEEFYCGDERCDCATGHLRLGGMVFSVDLGTTRVDFADGKESSQSRAAVQQSLREALQAGPINQLRRHYAQTREFGKLHHFRYVDWSPLKSGELVPWQNIFRAEGTSMFTMTVAPPAKKGGDDTVEEADKTSFLLGLADAYCVEPKCDCQRVVWTVVTAPVGNPDKLQQLGTVSYSFRTREPAVEQIGRGVDPNQLFMLVANLLKGQPDLAGVFQQRYGFLRQQLSPLLTAQRRLRTEARTQNTAGRNDPCPCGSGKKYKRCHGAA